MHGACRAGARRAGVLRIALAQRGGRGRRCTHCLRRKRWDNSQILAGTIGAWSPNMRLWFVVWVAAWLATCSPAAEPVAPEPPAQSAQQRIVKRASDAVYRLREQPRFQVVDELLAHCRAVLIFPRLIKASLVFGGEGGNGVLVSKNETGQWSAPAFYSLGAPSVGLQVGFREATVLLFVMNDLTLQRMVESSLTLGATTSITLGRAGERGLTEAEMLSKDVYEVAEAGGAFIGFSVEGYVIAARDKHNAAYYGAPVAPRDILFERRVTRPEAEVLHRAIGERER